MPTEKELQIDSAQRKINNINYTRIAIGGIGNIAGLVYAFHKKKGFWGYVGFMLLGGIVLGTTAMVATMPMTANAQNDLDSLKNNE